MAEDGQNSNGVVIVAIPSQDDYVWQLSSEKVPHMTMLFLGEITDTGVLARIEQYLEHVVSTSMHPFGMRVDHRGTLGPDDADVLFFEDNQFDKMVHTAREYMLDNTDIRAAYNAVEQHPQWTPHLTLGYPETPAHPDKREYPGVSWVNFDRVALWIGDSEGPEFWLKHDDRAMEVSMSDKLDNFLMHHGVKGMKWGVRRDHFGEVDLDMVRNGPIRTHPVTPAGKNDPVGLSAQKTAETTYKIGLALVDEKTGPFSEGGAVRKFNDEWRAAGKTAKKESRDEYDSKLASLMTKEANKYTKPGTHAQVHMIREKNGDAYMKLTVAPASYLNKRFNDGLKKNPDIEVVHADSAENNAVEELILHTILDSDGLVVAIEKPSEITQSDDLSDFLMHHGVKGMKWGVRRALTKMPAEDRAAYVQAKDAKWHAKVEANPKLGKVSRIAARNARRLTRKLKKDYKAQGKNLRRDPLARSRYDSELKNILENSLDRAAHKVHKFSPTRLSEVQIHRHPDGSITAFVASRQNAKIVKQRGKIARADEKHFKAEAKAAKNAAKAAMAHDDISSGIDDDTPEDAYNDLQFILTVDADGFVDDVKVPGEDTMAQAEVLENFLMHHGVKGMKWGVRRSTDQLAKTHGGKKMPSIEDGVRPAGRLRTVKGKAVVADDKTGISTDINIPKDMKVKVDKNGRFFTKPEDRAAFQKLLNDANAKIGRKKADASKDTEPHVSVDAERFIKTRQKQSTISMSDREIKEALARAKMVKEYDDLFGNSANSALKQKVEQLELRKKYSQLNSEVNPSKAERATRFIKKAGDGYLAYKKLDKASDGALSGVVSSLFGTKVSGKHRA